MAEYNKEYNKEYDKEYNFKKDRLIEIMSGTINKAMLQTRHKVLPETYLARFFEAKKNDKSTAKKMLKQICNWMHKQKLMDASKKIAYITFGRWQPPHKGHVNLLNNVLNYAIQNNGHAYIVVTEKPTINSTYFNDKPQKKYEQEMRNPLSLQKKINYLDKMFNPQLVWINKNEDKPYPLLKFYPYNFAFMYQGTINSSTNLLYNRFIRYRKRGFGAGSDGIISKLREFGYKKFVIIVGEDRMDLFKKTNPGIKVIQHGKNRGSSGNKEVLNNIDVNTKINLDFLNNFDTENYSGSKLRYAARNPGKKQQLKKGTVHNYDYFKHSVKIGKMTDNDVQDLITEIQYRTPVENFKKKNINTINSRLDSSESGTRLKLFTLKNRKGGKRKRRKTRKRR